MRAHDVPQKKKTNVHVFTAEKITPKNLVTDLSCKLFLRLIIYLQSWFVFPTCFSLIGWTPRSHLQKKKQQNQVKSYSISCHLFYCNLLTAFFLDRLIKSSLSSRSGMLFISVWVSVKSFIMQLSPKCQQKIRQCLFNSNVNPSSQFIITLREWTSEEHHATPDRVGY